MRIINVSSSFLVSTTHHLLAVDPVRESIWRVHSGKGLYFGIACDPAGRIYAACRNTTLGHLDETVRSAERGSVLVLDSQLQVCEELEPPFPLRDVHGIAWFDHKLWVTCSYDNMIAVYDFDGHCWSRWYPAPDPHERGRDVHHINTVRLFGDQVWLVAHQFGASQLLVYDYPSLDLDSAIPLARMAHDVFTFRGMVATCSSADGYLVNRKGDKLRTGNFPRGVAVTDEGHLLGLSLHAPASERNSQYAVLRWYTREWQFRADFVLPSVGMVLDVMALESEHYSCQLLEEWPFAEISRGEYNPVSGGFIYAPDRPVLWPKNTGSDWHHPEKTHCWSAARNASIPIIVSPGETRIQIQLSSGCPSPYRAEVSLNGTFLGEIKFERPGIQLSEFRIDPSLHGERILTFRVPFLWKPSDRLPANLDERALGVAVHSIRLGNGLPESIYSD